MILEQIAADTRLRLIEEKKLVSPEEMKERFSISADRKRIRSSRCRCHLLPDRAEIFSRKERIFKSDHR